MTRLKRSIEQRPSGNNAAAMSASLVQPAWDSKQSYYVRMANSASRPSRSTLQREQGALREVLDRAARLPDPSPGTPTRSPQRCGCVYVVVWTIAARSDVYSSAHLGA